MKNADGGSAGRKSRKLYKLPVSTDKLLRNVRTAYSQYKGSEGPKKSVKGPVRGGPATGRGVAANKKPKRGK